MSIRRVVPDINSERVDESREFYVGVLGFKVAMDLGWVVTFASPTNPTAQITIMRRDGSSRVMPQVTVEVADVDAVHAEAVRRGPRSSILSPTSLGAFAGSFSATRTASSST